MDIFWIFVIYRIILSFNCLIFKFVKKFIKLKKWKISNLVEACLIDSPQGFNGYFFVGYSKVQSLSDLLEIQGLRIMEFLICVGFGGWIRSESFKNESKVSVFEEWVRAEVHEPG